MTVKYIVKVITDVVLLLIVAIPILLFFLLGKPFERGFHCDDESLRYPYKDSTVHTAVLYIVGTFLPGLSMLGLEFWRCRTENVGRAVFVNKRQINSWLWACYASLGTFLFGCACSQFLTDVAKYSIGRLRPHFVAICQPDWSQINCTAVYPLYVDPVPCLGTDAHRLKEARLSFPSGHASFSAFTMVYFVIYLQMRYKFKSPKLVRPFIQFVCLMFTFYTSLSRISDYKHHWSDVFSGFILGTTVAILIAYCVSDLFPPPVKMDNGALGAGTSSGHHTVFLQERHNNDAENNTTHTNID